MTILTELEHEKSGPLKPLEDDVGIVVIGRNEGQRLVNCLKSFDTRKFSVVYVDSGSTDDSVAAAKQLGATTVALDMSLPFSAARARNEGFAALKALSPDIEFIQFIDGDCELDPHWLACAVDFITGHSDVAVVCGRRRERYPEASVYNWLCDEEWNTPIGETWYCGGDSLIRRKAFEAVGGYRARLIAHEEPELCARLRANGWKIWRIDAEMTRHDAAMMRFGQWWARTVRSGYGFADVARLEASLAISTRETRRAIFWAGILPVAILGGALTYPPFLWLLTIYPLQVVRLARRGGFTNSRSWKLAIFGLIGKFANLQGILKFYWRRWRGAKSELIEYKG